MSLNTANTGPNVVIFYGERILLYYDGVELKLEPTTNVPQFSGTKKGRIYLTTHRFIFLVNSSNDSCKSFSTSFLSLSNLELEQPVFGANYIKGQVKSEPNGNWVGSAKLKIWFNNGGAIEFGRTLLECGRRASRMAANMSNMPPPPPYTPSTDYQPATFDDYCGPHNQEYSFVPYEQFPDLPPQSTVYMASAPPPYPGISSVTPAQSVSRENGSFGQAYYNNGDGHQMYVQNPSAPPQHNYNDPPPSYADINKKDQ